MTCFVNLVCFFILASVNCCKLFVRQLSHTFHTQKEIYYINAFLLVQYITLVKTNTALLLLTLIGRD